MSLNKGDQEKIAAAVDRSFDAQVELTKRFVSIPSTRGAEWPAQDFIAGELRCRGYVVDDWQISMEDLAGLPDLGVIAHDFSRARTVVGTLKPGQETGRSIILQGHCDVVPVGPAKMWQTHPFQPVIRDGWLHGRGAADMKGGTVAALYAVDAIRDTSYGLKGRIHFQSVIEEESTGVGALSALQRGYRADCALLPEPTGQRLSDVCLGVIWFRVKVAGEPAHVSHAGEGFNAIKAAMEVGRALEGLEKSWNERAATHPIYGEVKHPLIFNPGIIHGGDWASSVPAWCDIDCRIGLLPDWSVESCQEEILACIRGAAAKMPLLANNPPEVEWSGYLSHGYVMRDDPMVRELLESAHKAVTGRPLDRRLAASLNDARFYDRHFGMPAFCYGPIGERIHGFNERLNLASLRETTKTIANFMALWCGIEPATNLFH